MKNYLNVEIDEELREQFKIKCLQDKTNMKSKVTEMIKSYLEGNKSNSGLYHGNKLIAKYHDTSENNFSSWRMAIIKVYHLLVERYGKECADLKIFDGILDYISFLEGKGNN